MAQKSIKYDSSNRAAKSTPMKVELLAANCIIILQWIYEIKKINELARNVINQSSDLVIIPLAYSQNHPAVKLADIG